MANQKRARARVPHAEPLNNWVGVADVEACKDVGSSDAQLCLGPPFFCKCPSRTQQFKNYWCLWRGQSAEPGHLCSLRILVDLVVLALKGCVCHQRTTKGLGKTTNELRLRHFNNREGSQRSHNRVAEFGFSVSREDTPLASADIFPQVGNKCVCFLCLKRPLGCSYSLLPLWFE